MPVPIEAQGAAFDASGNVWVSSSRSNAMSKLYRIDRQGNVAATYDVPIGLEGIAFDAAGRLWGVTESGTRKYERWGEPFHFPFVFEIDVAKLK
jgi:sugar lactone lactonase YvrE